MKNILSHIYDCTYIGTHMSTQFNGQTCVTHIGTRIYIVNNLCVNAACHLVVGNACVR